MIRNQERKEAFLGLGGEKGTTKGRNFYGTERKDSPHSPLKKNAEILRKGKGIPRS